jgi:hypothetical protein
MTEYFVLSVDPRNLCHQRSVSLDHRDPCEPYTPFPRLVRFFARPLIRRFLNIALASLAAFCVCGSAACAVRLALSH